MQLHRTQWVSGFNRSLNLKMPIHVGSLLAFVLFQGALGANEFILNVAVGNEREIQITVW